MKDKLQVLPQLKSIWVFKTSATSQSDIQILKPVLDQLMQSNEKWNFDLEDCDRILRVETTSLDAKVIIASLENAGYRCAELEDVHPAESKIRFPKMTLN